MGAWGVVYIATNLITGEQYVGQTKQPPHVRFRAHEVSSRNPKTKFHRAVADTQYKNFCFEVVASAPTREGLNATEKTVIAQYSPTYNSTCGGAGRPRTVSDIERARLSEAAKKRWSNPVWRETTVASIRKAASDSCYADYGRRVGKTGAGAKARWADHNKLEKQPKDRSASITASWLNPETRAKRIAGSIEASKRPEVIARRIATSTGRKLSAKAIAASAKAKCKPVYCPELQISFLSRSAAASYIGVGKTAVSEAMRHNRKIAGAFTLREVCYQL
jgi:hypothetical protein